MNFTIRTRLTVWYTALLVATLLVLGTLAYAGVWWLVRTNADEVLRTKFESVSAEIEYEAGLWHLDVERNDAGDAKIEDGLEILVVVGADGQPLYELHRQPGFPTGDEVIQDVLGGGHESWRTLEVNDEMFRVYTAPVVSGGRTVAAVQVGRSDASMGLVLGYVRLVGGVAMLLGLAIAWFGGHFIAGLALSPVERIRRNAEAINSEGLSRRLGPPYSHDELGALARSFDGMIDRLDQAFRRERQFTADASHELRTPLSILRTQIEVALNKDESTRSRRQLLTDLLNEVTRLGKLVDDMLTLARIDAGHRPELRPTALHDVVLTAADRLLPLINRRGLSLQVEELEAVTVTGDAGWLTQTVLALVQNAIQHTPPGGTIKVSLRVQATEAILTVSDDGEGIAPAHLPRIFDRFYRESTARTRLDGGAGLGLAICEWTVRAHGGNIRVESEPGHGATFTVTLPASWPSRGARVARPSQPAVEAVI